MAERIIFHGRVQGVGFRASVHRLSRSRPVTGYVRNLDDGSVELVAEGDPSAVQEFVDAIHQRFGGNITKHDRSPVDTTEPFEDFGIRH